MPTPFDASRREALRNLLILSAAAMLAPSCLRTGGSRHPHLRNLTIDATASETLASLADLLIPRTDTPGALDLDADRFALRMVDDCLPSEDRRRFVEGLNAFESAVKKAEGRTFASLDDGSRVRVLESVRKGDSGPEASGFYNTYRRLVIKGYTESEHYLTQVRPYELVPGRFRGCVPVTV